MTKDPAATPSAELKKAVLWDMPVRVIHWAFVVLVLLQWWTAENGLMGLHRQFGLAVVWLVIFRIYWGVAGTPTARFSSFVKGPGRIVGYLKTLRRPYRPTFGHNPVGAVSVLAMLAALLVQVGTGLFAVDVDGIESGHLSHHVSFDLGRQLADFHEISFNVLVALIFLHVAAVIFYLVVLRANLVSAMVNGRRDLGDEKAPTQVSEAPWLQILLGVLISTAAVFLIQQ